MPVISLHSRHISIGSGASERGPRIGGRAPEGVAPRSKSLRYFFTVPVCAGQEASVFIDDDPDFIYGSGTHGTLLGQDTSGIDVIVHQESSRAQGTQYDSHLSEHPLIVGEPVSDVMTDELEGVYSGHKMGGFPYLVHNETALERGIESLLENGFEHLVQLDIPVNEGDAPVVGSWPVGDALFHVLVRMDESCRINWFVFWEG